MYDLNALKGLKQKPLLSRRKNALRGSVALAALVVFSFASGAQAQSIKWNGGNGNWADASHWTDDLNANRAPAAGDSPTLIQSPGIVTVNTGDAKGGRLQILGGGEVDIAGGTLTTTLQSTVGIAPGLVTGGLSSATDGTGSMRVSGTNAIWSAGSGGVRVGNGATGALTVSNGGALNMSGGLLAVGGATGVGGTGTLTIDNGTVTNDVAALRLGYNGAAAGTSTGTLNILNGGKLSTSDVNSVGQSLAGGAAVGKAAISGQNSAWTITANAASGKGDLRIGDGAGADGTVTVSNHGALNLEKGLLSVGLSGGTGVLLIDNGTVTSAAGDLEVGKGAGSKGTVTVSNGGLLDMKSGLLSVGLDVGGAGTLNVDSGVVKVEAGALRLGYNGATGTLNILHGGALTTGYLNSVGLTDSAGAGTGVVNIDGAGSIWTIAAGNPANPNDDGNLNIGSGNGAKGTVTISNGGKVALLDQTAIRVGYAGGNGTVTASGANSIFESAGGLTIGQGAGSTGAVTISSGAALKVHANDLIVGFESGTGTLIVSGGGSAASDQKTIIGNEGGTGIVTIDGQGSTLKANGIVVGSLSPGNIGVLNGSVGTLNINNGAAVTSSSDVGAGINGSQGTINIASGGQLNGTYLFLGVDHAASKGTLNMSGGAQANFSNDVEVGWNGGTGEATITGQNTRLNAAGRIVLGDFMNGHNTTGTMTVADGAAVKASGIYVGGFYNGVGTLNIGTGGVAGTIDATIYMSGAASTLNFNHNETNYTFANAINETPYGYPSAAGSVNFIGAGTTTLTAVSNYTAATNINAGRLVVAEGASIANSVLTTVNNGATLAGAGSVGNVSVMNGATIAPTGMKTLTVKDIVFAPGSTYIVGVSATGQNGRIAAATANIQGGTVKVMAGSGNYAPGARYTILTATGGVGGQFNSLVASDFAFLTAALDYTSPAKVDLTLSRNGSSFASAAATANQNAVAGGLAGLQAGNKVYNAVVQQNEAGARSAFDALSGEAHVSNQAALINNALAVSDAIGNRLGQSFNGGASLSSSQAAYSFVEADDAYAMNYADDARKKDKGAWPMARKAPVMAPPAVVYTSWAQGFGSWMQRDGDSNAASFKSTTGGIISGVDATLMGTWRLGLAGGYSRTDTKVDARASSLGTDSYYISAYGGTRQGAFGVQAGAVYGWSDISSTRSIAFPGFAETALANYNAGTAQVFGEANYRFIMGASVFEPFAGVSYISHRTDAFGETGSAAALAMASNTRDVTFSTIGMRSSAVLGESYGMFFTGRGTLGWRHAFGDTDTVALASFAGSGPFTVAGVPITGDALLAEAGLDMNFQQNMSVGVSWAGQFGDHASENRLKGQFTYRW